MSVNQKLSSTKDTSYINKDVMIVCRHIISDVIMNEYIRQSRSDLCSRHTERMDTVGSRSGIREVNK